MTDREKLSEQYSQDLNLNTRISLHQKYSTNPIGYTNWLFDQYNLHDNYKILELGCGNGLMWSERLNHLHKNSFLVLTDISTGMIDIVKEKFNDVKNTECYKMDITNILFESSTFDVIIANSMLYHVEDLKKAISEVCRVLSKDGKFFCTTTGDNGMTGFLHNCFKEFDSALNVFVEENSSFNSTNAEKILKRCFKKVETRKYIDSLAITDVNDLISWIKSTSTFNNLKNIDYDNLLEFFKTKTNKDGVLEIPKEMLLYICEK